MATAASSTSARGSRRRRWGSLPVGIAVVLGLGVLVRAWSLYSYYPSALQWVDAVQYARVEPPGFFDAFWWPAGYPAFLIAVRTAWDELGFTIAVQHLLGLAAAGLLYASVRRLGAPRGVALVPAAVGALVGDFVYLEHILMVEAFFTFMVVAGLYLGVRALQPDLTPRARTLWLVAAAAVLALSGLVRTTGLVLPLVLMVVALVGNWAPLRRRALAVGVVALTAVVVVGAYAAIATTGRYDGLFTMSGWHTYARIAPTADCRTFTPPAGTKFLCESTPVAQRPGSFAYEWDVTSPARKRFALPDGNDTLGRFGRAAIAADPVTYAKIVAKDLARTVEPAAGRDRPGSGISGEVMVFGYRNGETEALVAPRLERVYDGVTVRVRGLELLDTYQRATRLGALEKLLMIALALGGLWVARGPLRRGIALFSLSAFALALGPAATLSYDIRYALPPALLASAAAALGAWALWKRRAART